MPSLNWIGKSAVVTHHKDVPFRLLEPVKELSGGEADTGNIIVQGDNLHALKALLPRYAGQVKCIYIDPPYNTGNEGWAYNDNVNSPEIKKWLGEVVGKEGETLDRHDRWLCMMYPRLVLLKQFLREDGAIFVSIDETEHAHLRLLMNEILGSSNFVADMVWAAGRKNDSRLISVSHEYIVCYAKNRDYLSANKVEWRQRKKGLNDIYGQYEKLKKAHGTDYQLMTENLKLWYKQLMPSHPAKAHKHYSHIDARGIYFPADISWPGGGGPTFPVLHPKTGKPVRVPSRGWMTSSPEKMATWIEEDRVHFPADENGVPCIKSYLKDREFQAPYSVFYQDGRAATKRLREIMGNNNFGYPKDETVLQELFSMLTSDNELIMDSFAGSGTTGHAVLKQNAEDGGNRRFILVEMDEKIAKDVTAERVRRVAEGYTNAKGEAVPGLGSGFDFYRLSDEPLFDAFGTIRAGVTFDELAEFVWFVETGAGLHSAPGRWKQKKDQRSPLLGVHEGRGIYLLYNGILKDKGDAGGNVLNWNTLDMLPEHDGPKTIYGARTRFAPGRLVALDIVFKQLPYELAVKSWG